MVNKIKLFFRTIPPWHQYTGSSRKCEDFSKPGVTPLDCISKVHDQNVKSSTIKGTFKNSIKQSEGNIQADWQFIKSYLWYAINVPIDLFFGAIGVLIFGVNIGLNYINIKRKSK